MRALFGSCLALAASMLSACSSSSGQGSDAALGSDAAFDWFTRAPLPIPRTELGVAAIGGKIYAIGGSSGSTLARVDEYDTATNTWTQKASMHSARRNFVVGVINGKIYAGPGMSWTNANAVTYVVNTEVYDPLTDTWTDLAPCPSVSAYNSVWGNLFYGGGAVNGRLYVVAVTSSGSFTYEYDPATDSWTTRAAAPISFSQVAATTLSGMLYTFASPTEGLRGMLANYDPVADIWVSRTGLPDYSRSAFVAANNKLYTLGGVTGTSISSYSTTNAVYEYDPGTGAWTRRGSMNTARQYAGAAETGGHVFVIGGDVLSPSTGSFGTPSAVVEEGIPR